MRLIDADELEYMQVGTNAYVREEDIKNATTVDAVPVVRCAVCRYFRCNMRGDGTLPNGVDEFECVLGRGGYDPMDFCSEGERNGGDHDRG